MRGEYVKMWEVAHKTERNKLRKDASENNKEIKVKLEWDKTQVTRIECGGWNSRQPNQWSC